MRVLTERAVRDIIDEARAAADESKRIGDAAHARLAVRQAYARSAAKKSKAHREALSTHTNRQRDM
jgi:hypothetical protein